jgi:molybdopterin/thiamine biosynthesis adenylyltransferase
MKEVPSVLIEREGHRYSRQIMLEGFGEVAQAKLRGSKVVVVGVGGLGSPTATNLTVAGVGHLVLIDPDPVEETNLNRQWLHWGKDLGRPKVRSSREKLHQMNEHVVLETHQEAIMDGNAERLLQGADVVVDCLDNWEGRFVLNDQCVRTRTPLVHAALEGMGGQITTVVPGRTPCLRCLMERAPKSLGPIPVIGAAAGMAGSIEAMEVVKYITGIGELLLSRMLLFDLSTMEFELLDLERKVPCGCCGGLYV